MNSADTHPQLQIQLTKMLAVSTLLLLIGLGLVWELWLAPIRPGGSWLAIKIVPLCLPLAGLLKSRMYTYRWLSLLLWFYFTEGVVRAASEPPPAAILAAAEIILSLLLFWACVMHIRLRQKHARRIDSSTLPTTSP